MILDSGDKKAGGARHTAGVKLAQATNTTCVFIKHCILNTSEDPRTFKIGVVRRLGFILGFVVIFLFCS